LDRESKKEAKVSRDYDQEEAGYEEAKTKVVEKSGAVAQEAVPMDVVKTAEAATEDLESQDMEISNSP